jgi:HK97 gp10 family phage protein
MTRIDVIGDKALLAKFRTLGTAVQTVVIQNILDVAADTAAEIAKEKAPTRTGEGAASITASGEGSERNVGPSRDAFYMRFMEFGTGERFHKSGKSVGSVAAQPFLRPALEDPRVKDAATNEFQVQMQGLKLL